MKMAEPLGIDVFEASASVTELTQPIVVFLPDTAFL
jgi:hypothetical protein